MEDLKPVRAKDLTLTRINIQHGGLIEVILQDDEQLPYVLFMEPKEFYEQIGIAHQRYFEAVFNPQLDALYGMLDPAERASLGLPEPTHLTEKLEEL